MSFEKWKNTILNKVIEWKIEYEITFYVLSNIEEWRFIKK